MLKISNLQARTTKEKQSILKGIDLSVKSGEIHAIMGPNGSGKSTLCKTLMGHPRYEVTGGSAKFNGEDLLKISPDKRAKLGIFLGFQNPVEVPGVTLGSFLRISKNTRTKESTNPVKFFKEVEMVAKNLKIKPSFLDHSLNEGSSGGEKKRAEILQMSILKPKLIILDEIDSGLDIDALKTVAKEINRFFKENSPAIILVTHYQRILNHISPHFVHIMSEGRIIKSGGVKLAEKLEKEGYKNFIK